MKSVCEKNYTLLQSIKDSGEINERLNWTINYYFDDNGDETLIECTGDHGNLCWKTIQTYKNGLLAEVKYYNSDNQLVHVFGYNYDDKKHLKTLHDHDNSHANADFEFSYKSDEKGAISEEDIFNHNDSLISVTFLKYDKHNNLTEVNQPGGGHVFFKADNKYDDSDRLVQSISKKEGEETETKFTYEYYFRDKASNWGLKMIYKTNAPNSVTKRKIEYY